LDLVPYMSGKGDKPPLYHLFAVVVHVGTLASDSGHYICYVKNSLGIWYKVDDRKVKSPFVLFCYHIDIAILGLMKGFISFA
jgi:ubiquitin C-terminal hydrolase